jgi:hypothetical protein
VNDLTLHLFVIPGRSGVTLKQAYLSVAKHTCIHAQGINKTINSFTSVFRLGFAAKQVRKTLTFRAFVSGQGSKFSCAVGEDGNRRAVDLGHL